MLYAVQVGSSSIRGPADLANALDALSVGQTVDVTVSRSGDSAEPQELRLQITLQAGE